MSVTILKSKLSKTAYPMADASTFVTGDKEGIDPVVLGRFAYALKANGVKQGKVNNDGGYRSYDEQVKMYALYKSGKLQATAAVPGTSWHGSRLALDTSTQPIRKMTSAQLAKYGLCKPLSKEGWHIQPIETAKMGSKCNNTLAPTDLAFTLVAKFNLSDAEISYISKYKYAVELAEGLIANKKDFSDNTIIYLNKMSGLVKHLGVV